MIKGKGQRLIPEELLKYLETYKEYHPDPAQGGGATLDDIVDSAGNKRFVEGNIDLASGITGLTKTYGKWSLCGTHLMIVLAVDTAENLNITFNTKIADVIGLPEWLVNKIVALEPTNNIVSYATFQGLQSSGSTSNFALLLRKDTNGVYISTRISQALTNSAATKLRIQFDLLIDSD